MPELFSLGANRDCLLHIGTSSRWSNLSRCILDIFKILFMLLSLSSNCSFGSSFSWFSSCFVSLPYLFSSLLALVLNFISLLFNCFIGFDAAVDHFFIQFFFHLFDLFFSIFIIFLNFFIGFIRKIFYFFLASIMMVPFFLFDIHSDLMSFLFGYFYRSFCFRYFLIR